SPQSPTRRGLLQANYCPSQQTNFRNANVIFQRPQSEPRVRMCLESRLKLEPPATEDDLLHQVQAAKEDFRGDKPQPTLFEARLRESVTAAQEAPAHRGLIDQSA